MAELTLPFDQPDVAYFHPLMAEAERRLGFRSLLICRTTRVEHERGCYACPLVFPEPTGETCPIGHKNWPRGCLTTSATSVGAWIRYVLINLRTWQRVRQKKAEGEPSA